MNSNRASVLLVFPLLCSTGCGVFGTAPVEGPASIETMITQVQHLLNDAEMARAEIKLAMASLRSLAAQRFDGNAVASFQSFKVAVQKSHDQADQLGRTSLPMKRTARPVFDRWRQGLTAIHSSTMRRRSQARLDHARSKYDAIERTLEAAETGLQKFNQGLRDHELFLGHDFNAQSLASIQGDVRQMGRLAAEVDGRIALCQTAARQYTESVALPSTRAEGAGPSK